jgi:hypothetical protein
MKPIVRWMIYPFEFLRTALKPVGLRFPFEAPSKFIFMNPIGGGVKVVGLLRLLITIASGSFCLTKVQVV